MASEDIYIGSYRLVAQLGSGTFGSVYLAQHTILTNRIVAIKIMHPEHLDSSKELIRFFTEAQILDKLKHLCGAKSEPGNSRDLKDALERELTRTRKSWLSGIKD